MLLIAKLLTLVSTAAKQINAVFPIRRLGELYYYLSIRIVRDRSKRQLIVVQDAYIDKIATKFDLLGLQPAATGVLLSKTLAARLQLAPDGYYTTNALKTEY